MVGGLRESKVRCIDTTPNTSRYHGAVGADRNCTGPEKASRAREKAVCWHNQHYPTRRVARCNRTEQNRTEQNRTILSRAKHNRAVLYYTILYSTVQYYILYYVMQKRKKGSRAVSAFLLEIWPTHHSSLRHAQELQNLEPIRQYIQYKHFSPFGSIVSRHREIR